jgi:hypothetical protein
MHIKDRVACSGRGFLFIILIDARTVISTDTIN